MLKEPCCLQRVKVTLITLIIQPKLLVNPWYVRPCGLLHLAVMIMSHGLQRLCIKRHFRTIFALIQGATGGAGAILLTITAQAPEERYPILKPIFDEIIRSYRKIPSSS